MPSGRIAVLAIGLAALVGVSGCHHPPQPTPTCSYSLTLSNGSFGASGGSGTATVSATSGNASDCSWTGKSDSTAWLTVSGTLAGQTSGAFAYSAGPNTTPSDLNGNIVVSWSGPQTGSTSKLVSVHPSDTCSYSLTLSNSSFGAAGGSGTATVSAASGNASGCSWNAKSDSTSWLTVSGTLTGQASGAFAYSVGSNGTLTGLNGNIVVSWSGPQTGSTSKPVSVAGQGLSPAFTARSKTGQKDNTCDVVPGFKVQCDFDASASTPAASITSYTFSIDDTGEKLGSAPAGTSTLPPPTLPQGCGLFSIVKQSNGAFPATVRLVVTSSDGKTAPVTKIVTFQKSGIC